VRTFVFVTVILIFGAAGEEILFRGYGFQVLLRSIGPFATILPVGVLFGALHAGNPLFTAAEREAAQAAAEDRAAQLHMPLVWPDGYPAGARVAMRVASLAAAEGGHAAPFVLAASRLAFCGGFDLDDPEVLAEAAAAAGLGLPEVLAAAGDRSRDGEMEATALRLLAQGANRLPVLRVGRTLFCGEDRIAEAAAAVRRRPRVERPTPVHNAG
jgi:2-hydroxychromene-2-carboxylate isomerase